MKGEYTGTDGKRRRFTSLTSGRYDWIYHQVQCRGGEWQNDVMHLADFPQAIAALQELQEEEEWVEIDNYHRISKDGERVELFWGAKWGNPAGDYELEKLFYNKGREVALAEKDAKAQALIDKVLVHCGLVELSTRPLTPAERDMYALAREVQRELK